jgi:hypothetical protein
MFSPALLHAVAATFEARADRSPIVRGLLIQRCRLTGVLSPYCLVLLMLSLRVGRISSGADRSTRDTAGHGAEACIARTRYDRTEERTCDGADSRVGSRWRSGLDEHPVVRWHTRSARIKLSLLDCPLVTIVTIAISLLGRLPLLRIRIHLSVRRRWWRHTDRPWRRRLHAANQQRGNGGQQASSCSHTGEGSREISFVIHIGCFQPWSHALQQNAEAVSAVDSLPVPGVPPKLATPPTCEEL